MVVVQAWNLQDTADAVAEELALAVRHLHHLLMGSHLKQSLCEEREERKGRERKRGGGGE